LDKANPNYSEYSVTDAVDYAFEVMQVTEEEVATVLSMFDEVIFVVIFYLSFY
jgi:hypothetical protein